MACINSYNTALYDTVKNNIAFGYKNYNDADLELASKTANYDKIVVFDKGKIVEQGTHKELLANNGYYANLYSPYFQCKIDANKKKQGRVDAI